MVPFHRVLLSCTMSLMLLSCVSAYTLDRQVQSGVVPPNAWLYVSVPEPGRYIDRFYEASGWQTRDAIAQSFMPHVARVLVAKKVESVEVARASARAETATHLVFSEIIPRTFSTGQSATTSICSLRVGSADHNSAIGAPPAPALGSLTIQFDRRGS